MPLPAAPPLFLSPLSLLRAVQWLLLLLLLSGESPG